METSPANSTTTRTACWEHDSFRERASPIFDAPKPLALWHLTSLDAPTVAVVWTLAFAWTAHIALPAWVPILLALVAWPVYIADRLLDARSAHTTAQLHRLRLRHHFHWRHRQVLFPIALASACAAAIVILSFMPIAARERNTVLAAAALVYFSCVHFPRRFSPSLSRILAKESLVAILFTAACVLPVLTRAGAINPAQLWPLLLSAVFFTLLAWLNCHAIERWESDGESSRSAVFTPALLLAIAGLLLSAILVAVRHPRTAALVAAATCSVLLLVLLDRQRHRLTPLALRTAADLVLLTPLALLFQ